MKVMPIDRLNYWVTSDSGELPYLVDLEEDGGCDCVDYQMRVSPGHKRTCKHMRAAIDYEAKKIQESVVDDAKSKKEETHHDTGLPENEERVPE